LAIPVRCLTCAQLTSQPMRGRCPTCAQGRRDGSTRAWRTLRAQVLERDGHTCQHCGAQATHAAHRTAKTHGGNDTMSNLHALCAHCNLSEGTR
jgi:5-methylcytosine-specific restriction endonuclease McrA